MSELFSLDQIVSTLGCEVEGTPAAHEILEFCIDSRRCKPGSLFVALPGTRTNGHEFVTDAFKNGASAALVASSYNGLSGIKASVSKLRRGMLLFVDSPLRSLQALATTYLSRFSRLVRVGVTGSNGKTTTKELIASVLSEGGATYRSEGNYNSEIGLPLATFGIREEHRYGVFEMAMNRPGEIANLAGICRPHHACITNVGSAHIGHIGSREAIAEEKRQAFSQFDGDETAYVYEAEPYRAQLLDGLNGHTVLFGPEHTTGFEFVRPDGLRGSIVRLGTEEFRLAVPGRHNYLNACSAVSIGRQLGLTDRQIAHGLAKSRPLFGRSELIHGPVTVYQDCYNANPESMHALFELLQDTSWDEGRKIVVLGAMKELGSVSTEAHREVAKRAIGAHADQVILVGEEFEHALNGSQKSSGTLWFSGVEELYESLSSIVQKGDLVVLKGSRSSGLERLVPHLQNRKG